MPLLEATKNIFQNLVLMTSPSWKNSSKLKKFIEYQRWPYLVTSAQLSFAFIDNSATKSHERHNPWSLSYFTSNLAMFTQIV